MAIPVVKVLKPKRSVLLAEETYCIEALMQDGKHYKQERPIRSKFAKALMLSHNARKARICLGTSWGVSTRLWVL
jgi:prolyl-tRNA synthetase